MEMKALHGCLPNWWFFLFILWKLWFVWFCDTHFLSIQWLLLCYCVDARLEADAKMCADFSIEVAMRKNWPLSQFVHVVWIANGRAMLFSALPEIQGIKMQKDIHYFPLFHHSIARFASRHVGASKPTSNIYHYYFAQPNHDLSINNQVSSPVIHTRGGQIDLHWIRMLHVRYANRWSGQSCSINLLFLWIIKSLDSITIPTNNFYFQFRIPIGFDYVSYRVGGTAVDHVKSFNSIQLNRFHHFRTESEQLNCARYSVPPTTNPIPMHLYVRCAVVRIRLTVFLFVGHLASTNLMKICRPSLFNRIEQLAHIWCDVQATNCQKQQPSTAMHGNVIEKNSLRDEMKRKSIFAGQIIKTEFSILKNH